MKPQPHTRTPVDTLRVYCRNAIGIVRRPAGRAVSNPLYGMVPWMEGMRRWGLRVVATLSVVPALCVFLTACGATSSIRTAPAFLTKLEGCLRRHGIPNLGEAQQPREAEAFVPGAIGARGLVVPRGVTEAQFKRALQECGGSDLRVGPAPITDPTQQARIRQFVGCMGDNGYRVPPPNFSGKGTLLDTRGIDTTSARWVATTLGCHASSHTTQAALERCVGKAGLKGAAKSNPVLQQRLGEIPMCLRHALA